MSRCIKKVFVFSIVCVMLLSISAYAAGTAMQPNPVMGVVADSCTVHPKEAGFTHYHFKPKNTSSRIVDSFTYDFANYGQYYGPYYQNNDIAPGSTVTFYCNMTYNASYAPWMNIYSEVLK